MNRFLDVDTSFKKLTPVYGYKTKELVSLEEALEPLTSLLDELPRYIKIAQEYCCFPSEHGLTRDESAALYIYTMEWGDNSLYRVLNKSLRSENRQELKIWFGYLKLFDTALDKLPSVKDAVWRGVALDIGKSFKENQIITWWGISSCTSSVNVIKGFFGNNETSTLFLIETINGKDITGYTEYESEKEVILRMGSCFRVKSNPLQHTNGSYIVHLIEIHEDNAGQSAASKNSTQQAVIPSVRDTTSTETDHAELHDEVRRYRKEHVELLQAFNKLLEELNNKKIGSFEELEKRDTENKNLFVNLAKQAPSQFMTGINIGLFGQTSTGKSTMLNSLLARDVAKTGVGETTIEITSYKGISYILWDVPGRNDEVNYLSLEYIELFKGLTKRLILIQSTVKENSSLMKLLDELSLRYIIVFNKFDKVEKEEQSLIQEQIHSEIKALGLKGVDHVYFMSAKHVKMFPDWLVMVNHLTDP